MRIRFHTRITGLTATAAVLATLASVPASAAEPPLPDYTAVRTVGTITVDGKLTEASWANAAEAVLTETNTGNPVALKSTVKVLWDDTYLYVGFSFDDPDAWATLTTEDAALYGEEVAEVFIDPENRGHTYYEFDINPVNQKVDLFILNRGPKYNGQIKGWVDWDFTAKNLKQGVFVVGDGKAEGTSDSTWSVEIAFPLEDFWTAPNLPPKDGDLWRMNFYRIERGSSSTKTDDWYAAFSPTLNPSFHTPWRFGNVFFKR